MLQISKLFLLILFLTYTTSIREDKGKAIEITIGSTVEYDKNNNFFKFDYEGPKDKMIIFDFVGPEGELYLTNPNNERQKLSGRSEVIVGNLGDNGTYYLEVICQSIICEIGGKFKSIIPGIIMETIDLTKDFYFYNLRFYSYGETFDLIKYRVINPNEDKYMYLTIVEGDNYYDGNYVPYYSDDSFLPFFQMINPFFILI